MDYLKTQELPTDDRKARTLLLTINNYYLNLEGILFHLWSPTNNRRKNPRSQLVLQKNLRYKILTWPQDDVTGGQFGVNEKRRTDAK